MRRPASAFGLLLLLAVPPALRAQACAPGALSLEARTVVGLPATFGIEGIATGPGGRLALWSSYGEILDLTGRGALRRHQLPDSIRPIGLTLVPEGFRILDERVGREFVLDTADAIHWLGPLQLLPGEQLDRAVWRRGEWLFLVRHVPTHTFILREAGRAEPLYRSAPAESLALVPRYHLSEAGDQLLLVRYTAPFDVLRLDPATGRVDTLAPLGAELARQAIPADSLGHWRALPAVPLDCGVLLTLSDLTGDRRLLVRYGAGGTLDRVTPLDAPLGLVARIPGEQAVLAARRTGELELVWYDWHWAREPIASP